jgi:DNA repair protein RecO (recombination protein O)
MSAARKVSLQKGYILHSYPYRNSSLLIEVFTREYGRVGLVARGARAQKSRYHGILQPLCPLYLSWSGRGELYTLTGAETQRYQNNGYRSGIMCAFYLNELVLRLLHRHDPHENLFDIYEKTMIDIGIVSSPEVDDDREPVSKVQLEMSLRLFEQQMLKELGYGLVLDHDVETGLPIKAGVDYDYYPDKGPVEAQFPNKHVVRISGSTLIDISQGNLGNEMSRRQAKRLLHAIIDVLLDGRPLNTRVIYSDMMAMKNGRITA